MGKAYDAFLKIMTDKDAEVEVEIVIPVWLWVVGGLLVAILIVLIAVGTAYQRGVRGCGLFTAALSACLGVVSKAMGRAVPPRGPTAQRPFLNGTASASSAGSETVV